MTVNASSTPGADPALHETDPEFVAYFDAWVRGETDADSAVLPDLTRQLVRLASVIASNGGLRYRVLAEGCLDLGLTPVQLKEVVYQAVAYVGYATVADVLKETNELLRDRGVELPLAEQSTTSPEDRVEKGLAVQHRIFGKEAIDAGRVKAPADEQHFQRYLSGNCFGDTVARGGLDLQTRELLTFAMLSALGDTAAQLRAHIHGNLTLGNDRATLLAVLTALLPAIGYPRTLNALAVLDEVTLA